jgi:hypothetical protein
VIKIYIYHITIAAHKMKFFFKLFYRAVITAVMLTTLFLIMNIFDIYLSTKGITGLNRIYILAPVQFVMILFVYMAIMYVLYRVFKLKM